MEWIDISVFISSTFNDMHAERDLLLKKVFPELSEWCARRRIRLFDIDLRWGVTSEDSRSKNTVEVCLRNIDRCRPFFLCFLGQRRGWVPEKERINPDTFAHYPGIADRVGKRSVTEMEIEHALLAPMRRMVEGRDFVPEASQNSLFFIRDNAYLPALNDPQRMIFTNADTEDAGQTDASHAAFIRRVRENWREVYDYTCRFDRTLYSAELRERGEDCARGRLTDFMIGGKPMDHFILEALKRQIMTAFPDRIEEAGDGAAAESDAQERRAEDMRQGAVKREALSQALEACFFRPQNRPVYVYGEAGSGKSTLLSQFVWEQENRFDHCCLRFCGATPDTSQWAALWGTILEELGLTADATADPNKDLTQTLRAIAANGKNMIVIDGVDELAEGLSILASVPAMLPENLRLILSFRSGTPASAALLSHLESTDGAALCEISPLSGEREIARMIHAYLDQYLKALDNEQIDTICENPAAANPLFLKIILRELRVFGSRSQIGRQLAEYGDTPKSAFEKLLGDLEEEISYNPIPAAVFVPHMVGALSLVRGLIPLSAFKQALILLTGEKEEAVSDTLAYYLRRLGPYLSTDGNRIGVSYQTLREASGERYAAYAKCQHTALAEACREFDPVECLYHHRAAENWTELAALSEDIRFLCCGIQRSGALRLRAELEAAENMVSGETLSCLRQTAALIGRDDRLAAPLFYKELRSPSLREQAAALCKAPWLRYEPIPAEAPVEAEPVAFQTEFTSEHMGAQGFCLADEAKIAFLLLGEDEVSVRDLRTGARGGSFSLSGHGRIRKLVCSPDGRYLAAAAEDLSLHLYRITLDDSLRLLALSPVLSDSCASVRFGGICLFTHPNGLTWQRADGTLVMLSQESGKITEKVGVPDRLTGCFGGCTAWKSGNAYALRYGEISMPISARINDALVYGGRTYVAAENKKLLVIDPDASSVTEEYEIPESLVSLTLCGGAVYGADRYGSLLRIRKGSAPDALGRITQGDNVVDMNTRLLALDEEWIAFVSMQRSAVLRTGNVRRDARLIRTMRGENGLQLLWSGEKDFTAVLSSGERYTAPYPRYLTQGHNLNEKNNLKAACSDHVLVYEDNGQGLRFRAPEGERLLSEAGISEMGGLICELRYVPETESFQATTHKAQFWEMSEQGEVIVRLDLPRSESNLYLLCPCGTRSAVLSRRVRVWEDRAASAYIIDVLSMIEDGRILWTRELSRREDRVTGLLYDRKTEELLLFYSADRMEFVSPRTGDLMEERRLPQVNFVQGAAVRDGVLFSVDGEGANSLLTARSVRSDEASALPSQRRVRQILEGPSGIVAQEGDEKLYLVSLMTNT